MKGNVMLKSILSKLLAVTVAVSLTACLASCGGGDSSSESKAESSSAESSSAEDSSSEPEFVPTTDEEFYEMMKIKSLVSTGNQNPMLDVIAKAKSGEEVTLAYIGGSITEGLTAGADACYAKLTTEYFTQKFGNGDNIKHVNAGLSGTPSILGTFRLERDVLQYNPDVVFIEFAVNDGSDGTYTSAYEGIIRHIYNHNPNAAVVLLFARTEDGYTAQNYMKEIGTYYNLPMISYADGLTYMFDNGKMTWKDFSDDQSHPNVEGHKVVRDMIAYYFDTVSAMEKNENDFKLSPIFLHSDSYENCHIIESDALTPENLGSWKEGSNINTFTKGWTYNKKIEGNQPLTFKLEAKNLYLLFKENKGGNLGTVNVKITSEDGTVDEKPINGITSGGWGNPTVSVLKLSQKKQTYTIEITMAEGSEEKLFEVLGFGYTLE
ncbi:MAG: SGNH/GDSL hydrolase family protein [Oscillospiraceae bacterium]|nr:SGNH/GDSL hydrolase family protein [Oscillospiraceae bacterium]